LNSGGIGVAEALGNLGEKREYKLYGYCDSARASQPTHPLPTLMVAAAVSITFITTASIAFYRQMKAKKTKRRNI